MIKIYIKDKPLVFCTHREEADPSLALLETFPSWENITRLWSENAAPGACFITADEKKTFHAFSEHLTLLEAAGGVVTDQENRFLLIERLGLWDLPKGKMEAGELPGDAALREVCEETGVCDVTITHALQETYHTYIHKSIHFLKKTYWFKMKCHSFQGFVPQAEENITDAQWMKKEEVEMALQNSYASIADLMNGVLKG